MMPLKKIDLVQGIKTKRPAVQATNMSLYRNIAGTEVVSSETRDGMVFTEVRLPANVAPTAAAVHEWLLQNIFGPSDDQNEQDAGPDFSWADTQEINEEGIEDLNLVFTEIHKGV